MTKFVLTTFLRRGTISLKTISFIMFHKYGAEYTHENLFRELEWAALQLWEA
jgi:hypothetical protein